MRRKAFDPRAHGHGSFETWSCERCLFALQSAATSMALVRGKKAVAAAVLHALGMTSLLARTRRGLLVLNYHRIRPDGAFETPFDEEVFGPSVSEFEEQVKWVAARFRILSESELIDILASGSHPDEPAAMITFDDG